MRVLISYTNFFRNISHSKKYPLSYNHKYTLVYMYSTCYSCFRFEWNLNFLYRFPRTLQIPNVVKIRFVGAELLYEDGQTGGSAERQA